MWQNEKLIKLTVPQWQKNDKMTIFEVLFVTNTNEKFLDKNTICRITNIFEDLGEFLYIECSCTEMYWVV